MEKPERATPPALDLFWEDADLEAAPEHPLERELQHQLDALDRYERLLAEAQSAGREEVLRQLECQHARQQSVIRELGEALQRARRDEGDDSGR